jgi:RNA polymerase sigma factor (sigma-70 family)
VSPATLTDNLLPLLAAIAAGDDTAFRQFYELTNRRVFNTILSYVRNREEAEDLTQEVYVEVFRSAGRFKGEASPTTWLYRIAVSKALDALKHQKRQKRFAFLTSLFDADSGNLLHEPVDFQHPGVVLEQQENAATLFRAIDSLPEKQKTVYILTRIENLSNIEAANVMAISVGAVESLLIRANENLRKKLSVFYKTLNQP